MKKLILGLVLGMIIAVSGCAAQKGVGNRGSSLNYTKSDHYTVISLKKESIKVYTIASAR
jgi:hypothetical protein